MHLLSPKLQAFVSVADNGTVHGAAGKLHITQTGVTQRIKTLEDELGVTLFLRSRKGMTLTSEGETLYKYCRSVLDLEGQVFAKLHGTTENATSRITVQGPSSLLRSRVAQAAKKVLEDHPGVSICLVSSDPDSGTEALKKGIVDIAILPEEDVADEFEVKQIEPEIYSLYGTQSWEGRELKDVVSSERMIDIHNEKRLTEKWLEKCGLANHAKGRRHLADNVDLMADLLRSGTGYGVLPVEYATKWNEDLSRLGNGKTIHQKRVLAW
ncbi:MAG: LysR family transcriptional regulator, partial [Candidatus Eisenbacteria bacterium]|nr:LysR family transcriptional regulator [Candidatus Eisenbacteria bacterium]